MIPFCIETVLALKAMNSWLARDCIRSQKLRVEMSLAFGRVSRLTYANQINHVKRIAAKLGK